MKRTIVILLALLLVASLLPSAIAAREDPRSERLKALSDASQPNKVLTTSAKTGKASAERRRVEDFRKVQQEKGSQAYSGAVTTTEKAKMSETTAPVGSAERRQQLLDAKLKVVEASKQRRAARTAAP